MADIHIIAGPTASGKSARALALAAEKNGVIINADALQIYAALPILTAQPDAADTARAPHRLYGVLPPAARASAAQWRALALAEIDAAHAAGHLPILCGGTGLYLKALLQGLSPLPDVPAATRAASVAEQARLGNPGFHAALAARDPLMAARLNPNDTQRLVRAWEILEATGESLAHWQALPREAPPAHYRFTVEVAAPDRDELYARCNTRLDQMLARGALDEVAHFDALIAAAAVPSGAAVTHALGFRPLQAAVRGAMSLADAVIQAKTETRQYAKRQVTWFRHQLK